MFTPLDSNLIISRARPQPSHRHEPKTRKPQIRDPARYVLSSQTTSNLYAKGRRQARRPPASLAPANLAAPIPTHPHCRRSESRLISLFLDRKSLGLAPHLELRGEQFELRVANQWGRDCGNLSFALCLMAPALLC